MAYLTKKRIKGYTYYYAEECGRKNGKVKRLWQKYLGTIDSIITAVEKPIGKLHYAEIFDLGNPAAYLNVIQEQNMIKILDTVLPKREQGLSLGFYLILAAMNRGIEAVSKRSMWQWFQTTVLLRVFPEVTNSALSSPRFWDNMACIDKKDIEHAWLQIVNTVLDREKLDISCTSFDGTNFYTFIGSFNVRCSLAKRGKNKQGRRDLRQINYALFCTRQDQFPLYFDVYEGNRHDSKEVGEVIKRFFNAFEKRKPLQSSITVVFDKGNNSLDNIGHFVQGNGYHFVGSVKGDEHKDLSLISNQDKRLIACTNPRLEQVKAWRTKKKIYDKELTVIVSFNNKLYTAQIKAIHNAIDTCLDKLSIIAAKLYDRQTGSITKGKKPTVDSIKKQVSHVLSGQYMKRLVDTSITQLSDIPHLTYSINSEAFATLSDTYLGKNIIITDNHDWDTEDIILAYRSQYSIEDAFKQMKDRKTGSWWPLYHWTDQKIYVHGLYCSITLLIRSLIMRKIKVRGINMSMASIHSKLKGIKEVINVFETKKQKKPKQQSVISKMDDIQKKLFEWFKMSKYLTN